MNKETVKEILNKEVIPFISCLFCISYLNYITVYIALALSMVFALPLYIVTVYVWYTIIQSIRYIYS